MQKLESLSQLGLAFFGLTQDNVAQIRLNVFAQIHEIVFHGQGGYDWHTVYDMPIWLRLYTFNKLKEFYDKQNDAQNNSLDKQTRDIKSGKIDIPAQFRNTKKTAKYNT
jgi:hypothetical protein